MQNIYYNPVRTYQGTGEFYNINNIINDIGLQKNCKILMIVWDKTVTEIKSVYDFLSGNTSVKTEIFANSNPTVEDLFNLYQKANKINCDLIIAIGGGSTLDVAKSLALIKSIKINSVNDLRDIIVNKTYSKPVCKWIGVPTTAGTGSEITCWATIWDKDNNQKLSVESHDNYASAAVVDSIFCESMPVKLAVSSALDAVAHATESYWAIHRNTVSKALALSAIHRIMSSIDSLLDDNNLSAREEMSKGSMLAGLAFSNTKTTACHSISYPLTMYYNIPHGIAVSLLIGPMITYNKNSIEESEELANAFGVSKLEMIEGKIKNIMQKAKIPFRLREFGVLESDLNNLAEHGSTKGRIDNNPVKICQSDILNILKSIY